jgi:hypothetical protein
VRQWLHHGPCRFASAGAAFLRGCRVHWTPEPCLINLGGESRQHRRSAPLNDRDRVTIDLLEHAHLNTGHTQIGRPSCGSWVLYGLGSDARDLPGFVMLVSGQVDPGAGAACWSSGAHASLPGPRLSADGCRRQGRAAAARLTAAAVSAAQRAIGTRLPDSALT